MDGNCKQLILICVFPQGLLRLSKEKISLGGPMWSEYLGNLDISLIHSNLTCILVSQDFFFFQTIPLAVILDIYVLNAIKWQKSVMS